MTGRAWHRQVASGLRPDERAAWQEAWRRQGEGEAGLGAAATAFQAFAAAVRGRPPAEVGELVSALCAAREADAEPGPMPAVLMERLVVPELLRAYDAGSGDAARWLALDLIPDRCLDAVSERVGRVIGVLDLRARLLRRALERAPEDAAAGAALAELEQPRYADAAQWLAGSPAAGDREVAATLARARPVERGTTYHAVCVERLWSRPLAQPCSLDPAGFDAVRALLSPDIATVPALERDPVLIGLFEDDVVATSWEVAQELAPDLVEYRHQFAMIILPENETWVLYWWAEPELWELGEAPRQRSSFASG